MTTPTEGFILALEAKGRKVRRAGPVKWEAQCPGHDDRAASLSVATGEDGRALLNCHAGCEVTGILAAVGWEMADLFPPKASGNGRAHAPAIKTAKAWPSLDGAIEAARWSVAAKDGGAVEAGRWIYYNADSAEVAAVARINLPTPAGEKQRKTFRPLHRVPGGWAMGDPVGKWPLYKLLAMQAAVKAGAVRVYVTEGEKAADAAVECGLAVTTSAHGSQSPEKTDWTAAAKAAEIIILPDHDSAGEDYGRRVAAEVRKINPTVVVKIVRLAELAGEGFPKGGDFADFSAEFRDGQSADAIRAEIEAAADRAEAIKVAVKADISVEVEDTRGKLRMTMASEIKPQKIEYVWDHYWPRGMLTVSQGLPGFGKTSTASDIMARLTRGDVAPDGTKMPGPADVIFLSAEESAAHIIVPRLNAQGADLTRVCIPTIERDGIEDVFWLGGNVDFLNRIADKLPNLQALVVDPFSALLRPDLNPNSNEDVRREATPIVRWLAERNVAGLGLNHLAKNGSAHSVLRGLGAGALNQLARGVWQIGADPNNEGVKVLASVKASLCQAPKSLSFTIGEGGVVTWGGHSEVTADSMLVEDERGGGGKTAAAADWLRRRLESGEAVPTATIRGDAEAAGMEWWAVKEAKGKLGVEAQKQSFSGQWFWALRTKGG